MSGLENISKHFTNTTGFGLCKQHLWCSVALLEGAHGRVECDDIWLQFFSWPEIKLPYTRHFLAWTGFASKNVQSVAAYSKTIWLEFGSLEVGACYVGDKKYKTTHDTCAYCTYCFIALTCLYIYISTYVYPCMSACLSINTHLCMQKYTIYHIIISFFSSLCLSLFLSWVLLSMRRAFYCMDKSKTQSFCEPRLQTVKSNLVAVGQLIAHTHTWTRQCKLGKPRNDIATWSGYENRIQIFAPKNDKSNHDICHGSVRKLRRIQCLDRIVLPWVVTLFSFVSHKSGTKIRPRHLAKPYTLSFLKGREGVRTLTLKR